MRQYQKHREIRSTVLLLTALARSAPKPYPRRGPVAAKPVTFPETVEFGRNAPDPVHRDKGSRLSRAALPCAPQGEFFRPCLAHRSGERGLDWPGDSGDLPPDLHRRVALAHRERG